MRAISRVRLSKFALQRGRPLLLRQVNAQAPAITISMSALLLANEQEDAAHIGSPIQLESVGPSPD